MTPFRSQVEETEKHLRALEALGLDVKGLWRGHAARVAESERGTPSAEDMKWELPTECPRTESHLTGGNEELSAPRLWQGLSYSLSPGMRGLLRDRYGLTPTATVTVVRVEPWPGTRYPREMVLRSDVHVDPRRRRHVLTEVTVNSISEFFKLALERDEAESASVRKGSQLTDEALTVGRFIELDSNDRWAVEDLSGVKVGSRIEVVAVTQEYFMVVDQKTGKKARVPRGEFFETVEEYARLHETEGAKRGTKKFDATPALDALLKDMGL